MKQARADGAQSVIAPGGVTGTSARIVVDGRMTMASGIGTYIRNLIPRIARRAPDMDLEVIVPPSVDEGIFGGAGNIRIRRSTSPIYSVREQLELPVRIDRNVALFWSPHYNAPIVSRAPRMITIHDVLHLAMPETLRGPHHRIYARAMFRMCARAKVLVFDSAWTASEFRRLVRGVGSKGIVVHPGVDAEWFAVQEPVKRVAPERPYLLFVGNVKPHKNLRTLVAAFSSIADRIPHDLVIVGRREGFIHGDARVAAEAERLGARVRFTGWVTDEDVRGWYRAADALVFPSLYEGFGLPPLEAMASGCPVIASRAASIPEVCDDAAEYFDGRDARGMGEAILRVIGDRGRRDDLIARGRERTRYFTWERCAGETLDVMRLALA